LIVFEEDAKDRRADTPSLAKKLFCGGFCPEEIQFSHKEVD